jgi:hypothetical protein
MLSRIALILFAGSPGRAGLGSLVRLMLDIFNTAPPSAIRPETAHRGTI